MNPCEMTASITAIANILAKSLSCDELAYWGTVFSLLGETMGALADLGELSADGSCLPAPEIAYRNL